MGILTDDVKQLVSGQLGFIATVDEKGWPDIAAKGTLRALDDSARCVGKAEVITERKLFDEMAAKLTQQGRPKPKAIIKINVIEVR